MRNIRSFWIVFLACLTLFASAQETQESKVKRLRARLSPALAFSLEDLKLALSIKVYDTFDGASVVADDSEHTFLGKIEDALKGDSIFNKFGRYGSEFATQSIWNKFGRYGSEFATHSSFNRFTTSPPFIVKNGNVIGRLTVNKALPGGVNPDWLKTFYK